MGADDAQYAAGIAALVGGVVADVLGFSQQAACALDDFDTIRR